MPGIRDLKGNPVDEVVTSRGAPPDPSLVQAPETPEKPEGPPNRVGREGLWPAAGTGDPGRVVKGAPLPEDFETGLKALEATLLVLRESAVKISYYVEAADQQMAALRARAHQDAAEAAHVSERLKKLDAIEAALK